MKIIISHDIDHLTFSEHWRDFFIVNYIVRAKIEWLCRKISFHELLLRIMRIFSNRIHNLEELLQFDSENKIPSTFFIGVCKGKKLSYSRKNAAKWVRIINEKGFYTGVHGNSALDTFGIRKERCVFMAMDGPHEAGIRMHYLHLKEDTLSLLAGAAYPFDSSETGFRAPYLIGSMWEFPLQLMDTFEIEAGKAWQRRSLEEAKSNTLKQIELAESLNLPYLTVVFHDCYYAASFMTWKCWYEWLIHYLRHKNYPFISFQEAILELQKKESN